MSDLKQNLDQRKGYILRAVVDGYVDTAEPIGSEWLAAHHDFGCRSATLRNEMADLADCGYLVQPHTSAGRIPSDLGYRYYVDRLMPPRRRIPGKLCPAVTEHCTPDTHSIVQDACRLLAGMTQYPSIASPPRASGLTVHRVYVTAAAAKRALMVVLFSSGHVEHRTVELRAPATDADARHWAEALNRTFVGQPLSALGSMNLDGRDMGATTAGIGVLLEVLREVCLGAQGDIVYVEGATQLLREREFQNLIRLEKLLALLEERRLLIDVLTRLVGSSSTQVLIGAETQISEMQDVSIVAAEYQVGPGWTGFIGVFGPTRMRYNHAVSCVDVVARQLSSLLSQTLLA